jgi:endonuclease/exonuclease/phosphatase family metal-dependent hydrolase
MAEKKKISNDHISELLGGIDKKYEDQDDFLDIVQWNLRWFNSMQKEREDKIVKVLRVLNSDIFVFQEIEEKSLDNIAKILSEEGLGSYKTAYGTTGGQQRVAVMWDMEWVRTKDEIKELFGKNSITTPSGKDVFPRLPLWSYFYCKSTISNKRGFDFQLVGLHLKSQLDRGGKGEDELQRTLSASKLSDWLTKEANNLDSDAIFLGDWNEPPEADAWEAFRRLERDKQVKFSKINDSSNFSHLYYRNRNNVGSLLDLKVVTTQFAKEMNKMGGPIHWIALDELLAKSSSAGEVKKVISQIKEEITDHVPVLTRFGFKKDKKDK